MVAAWTLPFLLAWSPSAQASAPQALSAVQAESQAAVFAPRAEDASAAAARAMDGSLPASVDAGASGAALQRPKLPQPIAGPAYRSKGVRDAGKWDDVPARPGGTGSWEVTKAGFWMGFNIAEFPAYWLKTSNSFLHVLSPLLFLVLAPVAAVFGLVGIVLAHGSVERWHREHPQSGGKS